MTQDEIIRMAREAGFSEAIQLQCVNKFERFAALVAAHAFNDGWVKGNKGLMEAVREEREACAKVCDELVLEHPGRADLTAEQCAAAIRARGDK